MWAIRRASNPIRSQTHRIVIARTCTSTSEIPSRQTEHGRPNERDCHVVGGHSLPKTFNRVASASARSLFWTRNLASQAGADSSDGEQLEEGFSELEVPPEADIIEDVGDKEDDESKVDGVISEEESDEAVDASLGLLGGESDADGETKAVRRRADSQLFKRLTENRQPVSSILNRWVEEGKALGRNEITLAMFNLRRRRLYGKALQFMEWLKENKHVDFIERDYASHLDLIAKNHGLHKAENFIDKIPDPFRGEVVYRTLLANCVSKGTVRKAEEVFNKIRDSGFPTTIFACNQLLLLYKRIDRKKIADVLKLMEQEDVQPSLFTYKLLLDTKGRANDIAGMEELLEMMKAKGMEPDRDIQATVARHYIFGCHKEKAEAVLEEIEGGDIKGNRPACRLLLPLYAALGKADEVERIWKACEANPRLDECLAAIEAMGELGKVEDAEKVFEHMVKTWKKLSLRYYDVLLKVYAKRKLLTKGKELAKRMFNDGCRISPVTCDALVKLHVESGEVEKADSVLQKAVQENRLRPLYSSYMVVLDKYAARGDIHNAEKIFLKLRQSGYGGRMGQYQALLQAYINAKAPAYGFRERMKADDMFPNRAVAAQLAAVDAFKKVDASKKTPLSLFA